MNKILIALGLTLAASTGAFAQPDFNYDRLPGASYGADYRTAGESLDRAGQAGVDYTATASFERSDAAASTQTDYSLERFNR